MFAHGRWRLAAHAAIGQPAVHESVRQVRRPQKVIESHTFYLLAVVKISPDGTRLHNSLMQLSGRAWGGKQIYAWLLRASWSAAFSAFQAAPRKTIIVENSIHTIKPIAAASPP